MTESSTKIDCQRTFLKKWILEYQEQVLLSCKILELLYLLLSFYEKTLTLGWRSRSHFQVPKWQRTEMPQVGSADSIWLLSAQNRSVWAFWTKVSHLFKKPSTEHSRTFKLVEADQKFSNTLCSVYASLYHVKLSFMKTNLSSTIPTSINQLSKTFWTFAMVYRDAWIIWMFQLH